MKGPLFLARRSYRRRRLRDVARLLPLVAIFLLLLPMLWGKVNSDLRQTAGDAVYLFAVWAGLVVAARILAGGLKDVPDAPAGSDEDES